MGVSKVKSKYSVDQNSLSKKQESLPIEIINLIYLYLEKKNRKSQLSFSQVCKSFRSVAYADKNFKLKEFVENMNRQHDKDLKYKKDSSHIEESRNLISNAYRYVSSVRNKVFYWNTTRLRAESAVGPYIEGTNDIKYLSTENVKKLSKLLNKTGKKFKASHDDCIQVLNEKILSRIDCEDPFTNFVFASQVTLRFPAICDDYQGFRESFQED